MQENIPDEWIGQWTVIHYKSRGFEGQPWDASVVEGEISEKNDLGVIVSVPPSSEFSPRTQRLIAYDAILSVDVAIQNRRD